MSEAQGVKDEETHFRDDNRKESQTASPPNRTKSNQRWMKLRTTVQLSGAITSTVQKKPPLKREDSFLKRFSTRQIPELEETIDIGEDGNDDGERENDFQANARIQRKKRKQKPPWSVVNPDGDFFYYWMLLVTICVLYNLWTLIVRQSFPELQEGCSDLWMSIDVFSDSVFLLDVVVQFRTGYLEQGLMVYDSRKLSGHYVKSKAFVLDLAALFPLELLQLKYGPKPILRFPRFLKVHRVYKYYYIVESRTVYPNLLRVMNLIHILLILAHWFGCFYYLISEAEGFQGDWAYPYRPGPFATVTRKYLGSLYWSTLTLTTIGDLPTPETNVEYVFTIVGYLIGVFIFATIVGQVGNVITNRNANRLEFERLLDGAKTFMRYHKVPGGMKKRVLRWYDYSWSRGRIQGGGDINTALGLLPDKLKTELALHVNLSVLKKVTIFQECQPEFLHDLVLKMKAYIFTPGDLICRKGEVAREMFIIADGILEVMSETGRVLTTMRAGDFFGEIGILNLDGLNKRTADVRSVGYSELFSLSREDVLNAMKDYPEAQEILQSLGRKRLKEAQNINRALKSSAFKLKEKKAMSAVHVPQHSSDTACKSRLDKLRSDVKELRNALRKSSKSSRYKTDDLNFEPLNNQFDSEPSASKNILHRMPRIYSDENLSESESQPPTSPKLGAGLPLLQRLKILKDKQERERIELSKMDGATVETTGEDSGSSMSLLQRTHDEKSALLNTATRTVQVRAQRDAESELTEALSPKDRLKMSFGSLKPSTWAGESRVSEIRRPQSEASIENESWNLLKKAVILPSNNSADIGREVKVKFEDLKYISLDNNCVQTTENNIRIAQVDCAQVNSDTQNLKPEIDLAHCDTSNEMKSPAAKTPRFQPPFKRKKIYRSIDDLSPEYSGLPFVKKLKILNERQKLAELEQERSIRSYSLDSGSGDDCASALARSHSEASAIEVVLRNQQLREERSLQPLKLDVATETIGCLSSPESNETLERKTLKTLLKKFSAASWVDPEKVKNDPSLQINLRQLMRSPTVEGYAARHSKFRTVSINKRPLDSTAKSSESEPSCSFRISPTPEDRPSENPLRRINPDVIPKRVSMCIISEESFSREVSPFETQESSALPMSFPELPEPSESPGPSKSLSTDIFVEVGRLLEEYSERFLRNSTSDLLLEFIHRDKRIQCLEKRIVELERQPLLVIPQNPTSSEPMSELTDRAECLAVISKKRSDDVVLDTNIDMCEMSSGDDVGDFTAAPFPFHWEDQMLARQLDRDEEKSRAKRAASLDFGRRFKRRSSFHSELVTNQISPPEYLEFDEPSNASVKTKKFVH